MLVVLYKKESNYNTLKNMLKKQLKFLNKILTISSKTSDDNKYLHNINIVLVEYFNGYHFKKQVVNHRFSVSQTLVQRLITRKYTLNSLEERELIRNISSSKPPKGFEHVTYFIT